MRGEMVDTRFPAAQAVESSVGTAQILTMSPTVLTHVKQAEFIVGPCIRLPKTCIVLQNGYGILPQNESLN